MAIFEDNDEFIDEEPEEKEEKKEELSKDTKAPDPGTRIIYQAPEKQAKREYVGFAVAQRRKKSEPEETVEDVEIDEQPKVEYRGGHDFEIEMRRQNKYPEKRKPAPKPEKIDESEIIRRRYEEYKFREQMKKELPKETDIVLDDFENADDYYDILDVEDVTVDVSSKGKSKKKSKKEKKKLSVSEIIRRLILSVAIIAIVISLGVLGNQYIQYKQNKELEASFDDMIITQPTTTKKNKNDEKKEEKEEEETQTTTRQLTVEEQWEQLKKDYPNVEFPAGISLTYAKFYAVNQDFVGYIKIDELSIGLPVVQSEEENYYLRRNIYKQKSKYGCPYVPSDNDMVNLDRNTVIYGHNMSDGSIFAPLNKYKTLDGYKSAPVIEFDTIYGTYKWKIVAAFISNANPEQDDGYVFPYNFTKLENDDSFMNYIECLKERSLYDTGVDVLPTDKILTLSTCTYDFDDGRFAVVARLVRPGESETVDTSQAKVNEKPHYPQAYYDKKKKKNPYKNSVKWYYYGI